MKKILIILTVAGVMVLVLGAAGYVYAQAQTPTPALGPGMMGGGDGRGHRGMMGQGYGSGMMMGGEYGFGEMGALHDYMYPTLAAALGLTPEEFTTRHTAGETFWELAEAQGLTTEEAWNLMQTARDEALQQAVADGVVTQEFAGQMLARMEAMHGEGFGPGNGPCHGDTSSE